MPLPLFEKGRNDNMSVYTFTQALNDHIKVFSKAKVVLSNDDYQIGLYSYENLDAERKYVVCHANCRGKDRAFLGDIIDIHIYDSKETAEEGYRQAISDCKKVDEIIKELSQRRMESAGRVKV